MHVSKQHKLNTGVLLLVLAVLLTCASAVSTQGARSIDKWNRGTAVLTVNGLLDPDCVSPRSTPHTVQEGCLAACSKIVRYASSDR